MTQVAIQFEPDGFVLDTPKLMGRQAAGNALLRAAADHSGENTLYSFTPFQKSAEIFQQVVAGMAPNVKTHWIRSDRLDQLSQVGTLYLAGPGLGEAARQRLRAGAAAYSIVGVTHTTASHRAMDCFTDLLSAPVMPWDALICTSRAVVSTVETVLQAELEHLRWRFGAKVGATLPQFPVIPLGVHCADFDISAEERHAARQALGIGVDEVVVLYVGRLSFHAKAHPHAMYVGLQAAAERTGKAVTLLQCGWFGHDAVDQSYRSGAAAYCPGVRALFADGRDPAARRQSWAVADVFISLADNLQETFGLTPVEAMAAGLPVVVSDWDGYKDSVRDGEDGFRIPTWMPTPKLGAPFAAAYEAGVDNYDFYCGLTCQTVALDYHVLAQRLADLIADPALRQRMGNAGRERARTTYDWGVVYKQYQGLWAELGKMRKIAAADPTWRERLRGAPLQAPARMDPFQTFGHYPTALIVPQTLVQIQPGASRTAYLQLSAHGLFNYAGKILPAADAVERLLVILGAGPLSVEQTAVRLSMDLGGVILILSVLAKMGFVHLQHGPAEG